MNDNASFELPLFPLSSIVMPGGLMPLRLFEPRYIDMVKNCFRTDTGFGVCLIQSGTEAGSVAQPYPRGTTVRIIDFDQGSDGLLHITAEGEREFRIVHNAPNSDQLQVGEVVLLPTPAPTAMTSEYEALSEKLQLILQYVEPGVRYTEPQFDDADWVCHRLLELLPLAPEAKYELLLLDNNAERLDFLTNLQIEIRER